MNDQMETKQELQKTIFENDQMTICGMAII